MNENQIVTNKNENTHMAANIFKDSFSKLNGKEVLIGLGIISATFLERPELCVLREANYL